MLRKRQLTYWRAQAALAASQEEAITAASAAAEAQASAESLLRQLHVEEMHKTSKLVAGLKLLDAPASPRSGMAKAGTRDQNQHRLAATAADAESLVERVRLQEQEIQLLRQAHEAANCRQVQAVSEVAQLREEASSWLSKVGTA